MVQFSAVSRIQFVNNQGKPAYETEHTNYAYVSKYLCKKLFTSINDLKVVRIGNKGPIVLTDNDKLEWDNIGGEFINEVHSKKIPNKIREEEDKQQQVISEKQKEAIQNYFLRTITEFWENWLLKKKITDITVDLQEDGRVDFLDLQAGRDDHGNLVFK